MLSPSVRSSGSKQKKKSKKASSGQLAAPAQQLPIRPASKNTKDILTKPKTKKKKKNEEEAKLTRGVEIVTH